MILFCIPHAGGSSLSYVKWKKYLKDSCHFHAYDLPGHGKRMSEELLLDYEDILEDLRTFILNVIAETEEEYAIFGHSMGAVLAYDLYECFKKNQVRLPAHLIFSGRWPPYSDEDKEEKVTFEEFKNNLPTGIDVSEIAEDSEMYDYFLKVIYSDLLVLESRPINHQIFKIDANITVLYGSKDDSMRSKQVLAWRKSAAKSISFYSIEGTHLFPIENLEETVSVINNALE